MPGGRPPKYNNCLDLDAACELYFDECKDNTKGPTVTGLALALGFVDRQSLYDNEKNPEFSCVIKRARTVVEASYEEALQHNSPTGAIFALKNMGWRDRQEQEISGKDGGPVQNEVVVRFVDSKKE